MVLKTDVDFELHWSQECYDFEASSSGVNEPHVTEDQLSDAFIFNYKKSSVTK